MASSDGLFDNLYEDEIALIIDNHISEKTVFNSEQITSDLLSSACELLVQKASKGEPPFFLKSSKIKLNFSFFNFSWNQT